jgi:hypothetical protein
MSISARRSARATHTALVMTFIAAVSFAGEAEKSSKLADVLPEGTIMYAEISPWSQWSRDFSKTSVAKIASEPEIRTFLAGPFYHISMLIRKTAEVKNEPAPAPQPAPQKAPAETNNIISTFFNMMSEVTRGPFSVAVRYSPEDAQAKRMPAVAAIIGVTAEQNMEATKFWAGMLKNLLDNLNVKAVAVEEVRPEARVLSIKVTQADGSLMVFAATLYKGRAIIATEVNFCTQIIDGLTGTLPKKLSDTASYKNTGLSGDEHLIAYLDVAGLQKAFGSIERPAPDAPNQLDDFFVLAGLNKTVSVAWSMKMSGPAFESRTAIFTQGERAGLLGTLAEEPLSADALKICPTSTPLAVGFRLQPERVLPFIRNAVKAVQGPKGLESLNAVEKQLNAELGRDLEKEVRAAYGNEMVITSMAGLDNSPLGSVSAFVSTLSVQDMKKAEELLGQVLTRVAAKTDANGVAANVLKEVEHDGTKIRYLTAPRIAGVIEITPAFALQDKRLIMAMDVPTMKRALKVLKEKSSLADSESFKLSLAEVGGKMGPVFSYVDWGYMYKTAFNLSTATLKLIAPTDILREIGIDMNLLPSTETVSQHLFPGLSVAHITPTGVTMISRSPLPSVEVISPPLAAVTAVFASFRPFVFPEKK